MVRTPCRHVALPGRWLLQGANVICARSLGRSVAVLAGPLDLESNVESVIHVYWERGV